MYTCLLSGIRFSSTRGVKLKFIISSSPIVLRPRPKPNETPGLRSRHTINHQQMHCTVRNTPFPHPSFQCAYGHHARLRNSTISTFSRWLWQQTSPVPVRCIGPFEFHKFELKPCIVTVHIGYGNFLLKERQQRRHCPWIPQGQGTLPEPDHPMSNFTLRSRN